MSRPELIARHYPRPGATRLMAFFVDPARRELSGRWLGDGMYRYRHCRRLRAALLLDRHLSRVRG